MKWHRAPLLKKSGAVCPGTDMPFTEQFLSTKTAMQWLKILIFSFIAPLVPFIT